jgi:hypothetical protein
MTERRCSVARDIGAQKGRVDRSRVRQIGGGNVAGNIVGACDVDTGFGVPKVSSVAEARIVDYT